VCRRTRHIYTRARRRACSTEAADPPSLLPSHEMRRGRVLLCALLLLSLPVRLRCDWASPASGEPSACGATFASGAAPAQLSAATQDTVTLLLARAAAYRELKSASGWARSLPYAWAAAQLAPYVRDSPLTWAHQARFAAELGFSLAALHSGQEAQARRSAAVLARMLAEEPTLRRSSARVARSSAQQRAAAAACGAGARLG